MALHRADELLVVVTGDAELTAGGVLRELSARLDPARTPDACRVVDRLPLTTTARSTVPGCAR